MSNHTPAPWSVRFLKENDLESGFFIEAKNNNKPELGYGIEIMQDDAGDHNGYPLTQKFADAKLIAAAPDLLEALKQTNIDLKILQGNVAAAIKTNPLFEGYAEEIEKWIARNLTAINKATK